MRPPGGAVLPAETPGAVGRRGRGRLDRRAAAALAVWARAVERGARRAIETPVARTLARAGFLAKTALYGTIAALALQRLTGRGGSTTDAKGALAAMRDGGEGNVSILVVALGIGGLGVFFLLDALANPDRKRVTPALAIARIGQGLGGVGYLFLAWVGLRLVLGEGPGPSGDEIARGFVARMVQQPTGAAAATIVGLAAVAIGLRQVRLGLGRGFLESLDARLLVGRLRRWAAALGAIGFATQGAMFALAGGFLVQAAWTLDPAEASGTGGVLAFLGRGPHGAPLLGIAAAGLVAYALYAGIEGACRRYPGRPGGASGARRASASSSASARRAWRGISTGGASTRTRPPARTRSGRMPARGLAAPAAAMPSFERGEAKGVDLPGRGMSWKSFLRGLKDEISKDQVTDVAATVTYYGVLSLFPFLLFLVALVSVVITPSDAERLVQQLSQVAPGEVTKIVGDRIRQLGQDENTTLLGFGAVGAIWAASGAVMALMRALNTTYDVRESRPFWKVRGIAVLMTLVSGGLGLVAALAAVATPPIAEAIGGPVATALLWLRLPLAGLVMMFLWALVYWVLPDVEQRFRFITPGSVAGVLLWVLASWAFSRYVASFGSYDKTYGSLGGVIVLLIWMWLSSLVLLVGAEANALIEHRSPDGKRQGAKSKHDTGLTPRAEVPPRGEPLPVGVAHDGPPGRGGLVPVRARSARSDGHARLGGLAGAAIAFVAGAFFARSRAG